LTPVMCANLTLTMRIKHTYDVAVVGLGAMGAAATYSLACAGKRVVGIDQFSPPHAHGSSHGETRITRLAIGEGEAYTPFALRSHEIWRSLEVRSGRKLLNSIGALVIGSPSAAGVFHKKRDFLGTTITAAKKYNIPHEVLTPSELRGRFPQFSISDGELGYFEYDAGYVRPEECITALLEVATADGASLKLNERVQSIEPLPSGGASVKTSANEYIADQVVVCAGPWLPKLLPQTARFFTCTRQTLFWFSCGDNHRLFAPEKMPVFIWSFDDPHFEGCYGFPALDGPLGGIKIASSFFGASSDADTVDRTVSSDSVDAFYKECVATRIPLISPQCLRTATCLYTVTPDADFVIGRLPSAEQIIIASPCSGHGFKHSAAIGETIAELATRGHTTRNISPFNVARTGLT